MKTLMAIVAIAGFAVSANTALGAVDSIESLLKAIPDKLMPEKGARVVTKEQQKALNDWLKKNLVGQQVKMKARHTRTVIVGEELHVSLVTLGIVGKPNANSRLLIGSIEHTMLFPAGQAPKLVGSKDYTVTGKIIGAVADLSAGDGTPNAVVRFVIQNGTVK